MTTNHLKMEYSSLPEHSAPQTCIRPHPAWLMQSNGATNSFWNHMNEQEQSMARSICIKQTCSTGAPHSWGPVPRVNLLLTQEPMTSFTTLDSFSFTNGTPGLPKKCYLSIRIVNTLKLCTTQLIKRSRCMIKGSLKVCLIYARYQSAAYVYMQCKLNRHQIDGREVARYDYMFDDALNR
jgi:hypothetical protein